MQKHTLLVINICLIVLLSCKQESALEKALELAGRNRHELEKVLKYYENDSLKQVAARFLIENMPYHTYVEEYYLLPSGKKYRPQVADFPVEADYKKHIDSLNDAGFPIIRNHKTDIQTLDSAFLVRNIELAFMAWKKPWAKQVPFSVFCQYILPYRTSVEYPSMLREQMISRFIPMLDSLQVTTPLEACKALNKKLAGIMSYTRTSSIFYPTVEETYQGKLAQCEGLCDLGTLIMRSVGIPIAVEQTIWTKMDLGHSWGAVWHDGKFHCFGIGEESFDLFSWKLKNTLRPAKVYRSHFNFYDTICNEMKDDGYISWLKSPLLEDITSEYLDSVNDLHIKIDNMRLGSSKLKPVYLCAFNFYKWVPVGIGIYKDSVCSFSKVAYDNILIVADSPTGKGLRFLTAPFLLDGKGKICKFIPDLKQTMTYTAKRRKDFPDRPHTLFYWNPQINDFFPLKYSTCTDTTQTYMEVPANSLLWFTIPDRTLNQRVFFIKNHLQ